jgi:hypothetical protein
MYKKIMRYRDADQREVDFVFEINGTLYPVEVKKTATSSLAATNSFFTLEALGKPIGSGAIVCLREKDIPLSREVAAIPVGYL